MTATTFPIKAASVGFAGAAPVVLGLRITFVQRGRIVVARLGLRSLVERSTLIRNAGAEGLLGGVVELVRAGVRHVALLGTGIGFIGTPGASNQPHAGRTPKREG